MKFVNAKIVHVFFFTLKRTHIHIRIYWSRLLFLLQFLVFDFSFFFFALICYHKIQSSSRKFKFHLKICLNAFFFKWECVLIFEHVLPFDQILSGISILWLIGWDALFELLFAPGFFFCCWHIFENTSIFVAWRGDFQSKNFYSFRGHFPQT